MQHLPSALSMSENILEFLSHVVAVLFLASIASSTLLLFFSSQPLSWFMWLSSPYYLPQAVCPSRLSKSWTTVIPREETALSSVTPLRF